MADATYKFSDNGLGDSLIERHDREPLTEPWTCQYVLTILVQMFCALPCSVLGTMHLLAARADYVRGYKVLARKKKYAATCYTVWGFLIGVLGLVGYTALVVYYVNLLNRMNASNQQQLNQLSAYNQQQMSAYNQQQMSAYNQQQLYNQQPGN